MPEKVSVGGTVAAGFENVREEFASVVAQETDPGAQLAVYHHERQVVDLWAGDRITGTSLHALYSSGKGAVHLVMALLVQDGVLRLDRPVAAYWPEFAAGGKAGITLRELLTHRAGLIGVPGGFTTAELADDAVIAERLAGRRPYWRPGTAYGYHAFTIGALAGEVVRRVTGRSLQQMYEELIRAPYGLDLHLGLPGALEGRYVEVRPLAPEYRAEAAANAPAPDSLTAIAFNLNATPPTDLVDFANTRSVRAQGPASAGSVGNARGLARMYAAAIGRLDGRPPLLRARTLTAFTEPHSRDGADLVTGENNHFLLGFEAQAERYPDLGADAFGHSGAVGAQSFADPRTGIAYAYTRRSFAPAGGGGALENTRLIGAVLRAAQSRR